MRCLAKPSVEHAGTVQQAGSRPDTHQVQDPYRATARAQQAAAALAGSRVCTSTISTLQ